MASRFLLKMKIQRPEIITNKPTGRIIGIEDLLEENKEDEILKLTEVLSKYIIESMKWKEFQEKKKSNDKLYCYYFTDKDLKGICIVRNDRPILNFEVRKHIISKIK